jgi:hypothetical protein
MSFSSVNLTSGPAYGVLDALGLRLEDPEA